MTPAQLRFARESMGWSSNQLGQAVRLSASIAGSHIREMETGARPISGPITVCVEAFLRYPDFARDCLRTASQQNTM